MPNLCFRPIELNDRPVLQAMIQGSDELDPLNFNDYAQIIFVATRDDGTVIGFTFGSKGENDESATLKIQGTYLRCLYNDSHNKYELHLAFINWAKEKLGVNRYQINGFDEPVDISIPLSFDTTLHPH